MPTKKTFLPRKELVWYAIAATLATLGLVFLVFGIIGSHLPVKASDNWVKNSENTWLVPWSKMGYRWWGLIILGVGLAIGIIALCVFARSGDRDSERAERGRLLYVALTRAKEALILGLSTKVTAKPNAYGTNWGPRLASDACTALFGDELPAPILRTDVLDIKDLKPGMVLTGTVRNVIDFGVFVDIGVHQDGLVHISQVCNKFIKHPSEAVAVGDVVKVVVLDVDEKKHRISLSMKQVPKE